MKLASLSLLVGPALAFSAKAQVNPFPSKLAPNTSVVETLRGSANRRYVVLKRVTAVYHQPADTANGRYAFKLFPGKKVYMREEAPGGVLIDLGHSERYYLPAKSLKGLQAFVEI